MSNPNKLLASAGAEWLLNGFALLRKAPLALGMLGVLWGVASLLVVALGSQLPVLFMALQLLLVLAGPLFFGAMIWAVREVDQGRRAHPAHLLQPIRDGHAPALLATLLPQVVAALVLGGLLFAMIGSDQLKHLADVWLQMQAIAEAGGQPDPSLVEGLPAGRLLLWFALVIATFVAIKWMTFIAAPQILFDGVPAWTAMRNSLRACLHNWPAMLVFYLLAGIAIFVTMMGTFMLALVLQLAVGAALAMMLWQLLLLAVLMPLLAGAMYAAWRQMLGRPDVVAPGVVAPSAPSHFEA
ncbi:BPSS1780 family membrane protein [Pseudoxanthomonas dokdonensis]|uniref:Membrane protein n=1 Tax=Pseudoxanthomonas dokdonensis TaxID=344882 RepID=A0A0R0CFX8_9GAMM|nr:BPSS1780 family membrane protein [Pseudoxanthomonas dokdonensis]KRG68272.1 membrane protein [Pseudoxanthomonas dokdonensis]